MEAIANLLLLALASYGVTVIVTESYAAKGFRRLFRDVAWEVLPNFLNRHFVLWFHGEDGEDAPVLEDADEADFSNDRDIKGFDFVACPMCCGFWITAAMALAFGASLWLWLAAYGLMMFAEKND